MPTVTLASVGGGVVVLTLDVDTAGVVTRGHLANNSTAVCRVVVIRAGDVIFDEDAPPGQYAKNLPGPRRFPYATTDLRAELTVRWP